MKRVGCLHAHHSNIDYIESAFAIYDIEFIHFVDPGLMTRLAADEPFSEEEGLKKVKDQIEWIAQSRVDAILVTCTNYVALLDDVKLAVDVPIIKIDEPFFETLLKIRAPHTVLFTNPGTVQGTMHRLQECVKKSGLEPYEIQSHLIEDTFDLIMRGQKRAYVKAVQTAVCHIQQKDDRVISVGQLSMVDAIADCHPPILNPLNALVDCMEQQFDLKKRRVFK